MHDVRSAAILKLSRIMRAMHPREPTEMKGQHGGDSRVFRIFEFSNLRRGLPVSVADTKRMRCCYRSESMDVTKQYSFEVSS